MMDNLTFFKTSNLNGTVVPKDIKYTFKSVMIGGRFYNEKEAILLFG